jgi:hypothetical protein
VSGRTLFVVLVQMLGLVLGIWILGAGSSLLAEGWPSDPPRAALVFAGTLLGLCLWFVLAPGSVARLCGWPPQTAEDRAPSSPVGDWSRVARVAVGWFAVVSSIFPLVWFVRGLPDVSFAGLLWRGVPLAVTLGLAAWLLWPRRTARAPA